MQQTQATSKAAAPARKGPDRPVFVVGCARSGTTLLQLMLHAHPRIAIPPETRYLVDVYNRRAKFGNLARERNREKLAAYILDRPGTKFDDLGLDREEVRAQIVNGPPTIGSALGIILRAYAERWDKPRWGDKRPAYIQRLDALLALFPDVQIVHIIRDGRDCVASLKQMPWWTYGTIASIYKWVHAIETGRWARTHLAKDQYHEISYERLVKDPRSELEPLCAFLGEQFHPAMLEPHKMADEAVPERKTWHTRTKQAVSSDSVAQWRRVLEPWELALMEKVAARQLKAHGYRRSTLFPRPPADKVAEYEAFVEEKRKDEGERQAAAAELEQSYRWPVAARLTSRQRKLAKKG
ncbi:MAG: sulfotransferase [Actinomycetota bacterium]|nr:sulfotransferase [Actinomycetota bacterium]